ncbi:MAG: two-component system OmpR family response regulator [Zhongshania sp.]|jgi:two-component system OmpR family response regulator
MSEITELTKLMYIEDETDIRVVAEIALSQIAGFTVKICASGNEGLESLENFRPQLILLDVMMPGMDGPQVLEKIQQLQEFCDTPVVFITAKAQIEEINKLKTLGAIDVITKPFNPMTLGDEIKTIWQRHYDDSKRQSQCRSR